MNITIIVDDIELTAELKATPTSKKILASLPIESRANTWGEEIYFEIPVDADLEEHAVEEVKVGTLAYWPTGRALCIFFGPTPASTGSLPRAYSPVNVIGRISGDLSVLKKVGDGAAAKVQK
jgi:hypothetical protein